jgi:hypothetical protein
MKTNLRNLRLIIMLVLSVSTAGLWAQVGGLEQTGDMTVCLNSTESYGVEITAGSTYVWSIIAGTGGAGTIINGAAPNNLISVNWTSSGTCTLQVVETNATCTGVPVNILVTVLPDLVPGTVSANQTICYNTIPAALTSSDAAGGTGSYTYQWESSPDGTNWTPISGATSSSYTPIALTATTSYRLKQTSGTCGTVTTNFVTITVQSVMVAGVASTDQTICFGSTPTGLSSTAPTGGPGTYTYQWEFSTDAGSTWTPISGANALTYSPGVLNQTTLYHLLQISSTCGTVTTNSVIITVQTNLLAGTVSANQTICYNTIPAALISVDASGGTGSYTYQWESSPDGTTWTPISGATTSGYTPVALTATTQYRLKQTSGTCGTVTTNAVIITVQPQVVTSPIWHN